MACSKNNNNNNHPDAPSGDDAPNIDAPVACTATVFGAQDVISPSDGMAAIWGGPVTTDLGGGGPSTFQVEFYSGIETSLTVPLDLSMGKQNNYATCAACVRVFDNDATGAPVKQFFQSGGTLTLTEDPFTNGHMIGTITDLALIEVTISTDGMFTSTPVVGGVCLSLGTVALDHDSVPNAWTCAKAAFNDGVNCDCACGAHDPDCDLTAPPVVGCTGTQVCVSDVCTDSCDVLSTPAVGCPTGAGTCGYENATTDICYSDATLVDPALIGGTCASTTPLFCAVVNTVATGLCDNFVGHDQTCRKACDQNTDCVGTDVCSPLFASPATKGLCVPAPPANDKCSGAIAITLGTPITGNSAFATSNYNSGLEGATCTGGAQAGPDLAYKINLTAGQAITATLTNVGAAFDPSLAILGPGTAAAVCGDPADTTPVVCLAGADAGLAGVGETFTFTAVTAGTYFIIVDTFSTPGGAFTLTVN